MRATGEKKKSGLAGKVFSAVGLAIGVGILIGLFWYVKNTVDLAAVLASARPGWLIAAVCAVPAYELLDALIFYRMGRKTGCRVTGIGCLDAVFIGEFYYRLGAPGAPVQLGLMVVAGFTGPETAVVYTFKLVANTIVYGLYAVSALCAKLLVWRAEMSWAIWGVAALVTAYVLLCAAVFWAAARPESLNRLAGKLLGFLERHIGALRGKTGPVGEKIGEFCRHLALVREKKGLFLQTLALMFLELSCLFSIPALIYFGLGLTGVGFAELMLTQCLVMVLSRVVMLPGNAGGAEGSFYLFMEPYFGPLVSVATVLWRCVAFVEVMALGGLWSILRFFRLRRSTQ